MTRGSVMNARIRIEAPQRGHTRGSTSYTRRISSAHRLRSARRLGSGGDPATGVAGPGSTVSSLAASRRRLALITLEYAP